VDNPIVHWTTVALLSVASIVAIGTPASGEIIKIVTPPSLANVEGSSFATPAAVPRRIQFLIPASDFAGLPESHQRIVAFNFRSDAAQNQPFDWASSDSQIWFSTTDKTPLTLTNKFDDNHGADKTLVHDGAFTLPLLGTGPPQGPRGLADGPRLDTPFDYDPSQGNLLLEWIRFDNGNTPRIDVQPSLDAGSRVLLNQTSATAATGSLNNVPAVIRFEFDVVPEPSSIALTCFALACLLIWRRKSGCLSRQ
jgi:hypothetical protein